MEDFWPEDIADSSGEAPVALLRYQARMLGERTRNLIEAQVKLVSKSRPHDRFDARLAFIDFPRDFLYAFYIVAPTLDNYSYLLFHAFYGPELYPAGFKVHTSIIQGLKQKLDQYRIEWMYTSARPSPSAPVMEKFAPESGQDPEPDDWILVAKEKKQFESILQAILQAPKTKRVVHGLLDQLPDLGPAVHEL